MPAIDRPNAPKRLPSSFLESGLFRNRRTEDIQQNTYTPSPSSISPKTIVSQKKTVTSSHRRIQTEISPKPRAMSSEISASLALESIAPGVRRTSVASHSKQSRDSSTSDPVSSRSSVSSKAKKLLNISHLRVSGNATKQGELLREAHKGFHWQREISGHWLEIRIGRKQSSSDHQAESASNTAAPTMPTKSPRIFTNPPSAGGSPELTAHSNSESDTIYLSTTSQQSSHRDGFMEKTRRRLGIRGNASAFSDPRSTPRTGTGEMLERTSSRLRVVAMRQPQKSPSPSSGSRTSSSPSAKAPKWQRIRGEQSTNDDSSSSSMRSIIQGNPPATTPEPHEMYLGSDNRQYFRVEMTDSAAPNFLPSEARRVNTPPISRNKARGFFFDYKPPTDQQSFSERPLSKGNETAGETDNASETVRRVSASEWYNVQLEVIDAEHTAREQYVSQVPDHLPNSLLCPRHPRHKSGGKGECPLHGRRETESSEDPA